MNYKHNAFDSINLELPVLNIQDVSSTIIMNNFLSFPSALQLELQVLYCSKYFVTISPSSTRLRYNYDG